MAGLLDPEPREARRGFVVLVIVALVVLATGLWQLVELRSFLREHVLETNLSVARVAARVMDTDLGGPPTVDEMTRKLEGIEIPDGGRLMIFDPTGRALLGADEARNWASHPAVGRGLEGRTGVGEFEAIEGGGRRLMAYASAPGSGAVVVVDRPTSAAGPDVVGYIALRTIAVAGIVLIGAILVGRLLKKLTQSRNESSALLASMAEGAIIVDPGGLIASINPAMERLAGWDAPEVAGRPSADVYPLVDGFGDLIPPEKLPLSRALERKWVVTSRGFDLSLVAKGGDKIPVNLAAAPVFGSSGEVMGAIGIVRDVSYEHQVDELKSSLISTVSHEFRTPLTMIRGYAELLHRGALKDKAAADALHQISLSAERLTRLVEDLLSVSRIEAGELNLKPATVPLDDTINEVAAGFRASHGRAIDVELDPNCRCVLADRDRLVQMLTNLLSNAIKYSPEASVVTVMTRRSGEFAQVAVRDRGIGMTSQDVAQLFNKFFRAERDEVREAGGTGLGLYIVRRLVELHGGRIWVNSEPGAGSTFIFTLPCIVRSEPAASGGAREVS